jgi:diaminohydroxyphosphoribosylaminopyrimidine deaminase/5-amino-6-(5-phosphoribosylamino)uracil reductase
VLEEEARELNRMFVTAVRERRPYVHVKVAQSLDGRINRRTRGKRWITGSEARRLVHTWRTEFDAVLVGAGTVRADNPLLTVRGAEGRNPTAVILDGGCSVSPRAALFDFDRRVLVIVDAAIAAERRARIRSLKARGAEVVLLRAGAAHRIGVHAVLRTLYRQNIGSVLVEGGGEIFTQFLSSGVVDELSLMIAPEVIGDGLPAFTGRAGPLKRGTALHLQSRKVGRDILLTARKSGDVHRDHH